ncbi:MAG TPA: riboflavin kinase [Metabacillus sp.]|nr:riboflavin kinase [Metabacillus sp.]
MKKIDGYDLQVIRGNQIGRTIGFPTANLLSWNVLIETFYF